MKIRSLLIIASITAILFACGSDPTVDPPAAGLAPPADTATGDTAPTPPGHSKLGSDGTSVGTSSSSGGSSSGAPNVDTDSGSDADTDAGSGSSSSGGSSSGDVPPPPPPPPPTTAIVGGVEIDFVSQDGNTFCYRVTELDDAKDLSHWDIATNCTVLSGTPTGGFVIGTDPKSGLTGAKWNVSSSFETGLFCLTVDGSPTLGTDAVASKSGYPISYGTIVGPVCQ